MPQDNPSSPTIFIHVRPIGLLRKFARDEEIRVDVGTTPKGVIELLRIPDKLKMVGFINGGKASLDDQLQDGDELKLVTLATGG
ncbi:MAG: MoaD/ThiS family protein [Thermodesulfobacteriota bacterium]|nr:MoaD/ThiS family protein [Thermodesulfobacteriota bacterium]